MAKKRDISVDWPDDYVSAAGLPMSPSKQQIAPPGVAEPDSSDKKRKKAAEPTKKLQMTKVGRAAARRSMSSTYNIASGKPKTMPSSKQRMRRGMNPTLNNPNDVGAKIIPQGTPSTL